MKRSRRGQEPSHRCAGEEVPTEAIDRPWAGWESNFDGFWKESNVTNLVLARKILAAAAICSLVACAPAPHAEREIDTSKIPVTTASDTAYDAFLMGRWLLDNLRVTDAHGYFLKAVEADPEFALAYFGLANTASTNQDFFDAFRRAVETSANASEGEQLVIGAFEDAVNGDPESQLAKLEALVALFPEDERAHNQLGNFLFFNQQNYERAITTYRRSIEVNPDFRSADGHLLYARTLESLGMLEEAVVEYRVLADSYPGEEARARYGLLLKRLGDANTATAVFREILLRAKRAPRYYRKKEKHWIQLARMN
jgi:hypothetical protein